MPRHLTTDDSADFVAETEKGAANGVATLDSSGKVPTGQLPSSITTGVTSVNGQTGNVILSSASIGAVPTSAINAPGGVAPLDVSGLLPAANLPSSAVQSVNGHTGASVTVSAADVGALTTTNNLSDLSSTSTARTNLGLGGAAVLSVGTSTGTVAAGDDSRITGAAQKAQNLADLGSAATARTNLGLGGAATLSVGTTTGTVAAGDDSRITGALQAANNLSDLASAATARTNLGLAAIVTAKSNLTATTNPGTGNDTSQGYSVGSIWVNTSTNTAYVCSKATTGAAVWTPVLPVGTTSGTIAAGDDSRITGAAQKANNLSDLASASTARTNLGLGTAATAAIDTTSTDIAALGTQAAGATGKVADAGHVHAMPRLDQVNAPTAAVALNGQKITGLANGTTASDAAAFGQIPTAATSSSQGIVQLTGDLGGTASSPQVVATHLAAALPIAQGGTGQTTASAALTALGGVSIDTLVFNVKDHGAKGDGTTNDTSAVTSTISACSTAGGGIVYFPTGTYLVTPTSSAALAVPSNVLLVGENRKATQIKKSANGVLIAFSGPSTDPTGATHVRYSGLQNISLNGNSLTGALVQCYYADNLIFRDVYSTSNNDVCVDGVEFWDSRFFNCVWESSGGAADSTTPNVWLRNSAASSGFGYSTDNCNQIFFHDCRWENFFNGALRIEQGTNNTNNPNGIYVSDCKMETSQMRGGSHLFAHSSCKHIYVNGLYAYAGGFYSGYSTAQNIITWSAQHSVLENVLISNSSTATVNSGLDLFSASGSLAVIRNIVGTYTTSPTNVHLYFEGSSAGDFNVQNCYSNTGTQVGGTVPTTWSGHAPVRLVSGAVSDSSFAKTPMNGILALDSTNNRLYARIGGTWKLMTTILDATATDIQPLGTQAAGSVGQAADAGHVHAMPRLDQISAPTASVALNGQKITGLANGSAATDAAAFGQVLPLTGGSLTGALSISSTAASTKSLDVSNTASDLVGRFTTTSSGSGGNTQPVVGAIGADTSNRAFGAEVSGDTSFRWVVFTDGKQEWGAGSSRDTNLYRGSANVLTTDNNLDVASNALGIAKPTANSYVAWTFDPANASSGKAGMAGVIYLAACYVNKAATVTKLTWGINTAGASATAGQNFVGLYNSSGTRLASVGVDARVTTTGAFTETISASVTPGLYYVAFLFNATTMPQVYRGGDLNATLVNFNLTGANLRFATNSTGQTSLPSSLTLSSNAAAQFVYWAAIG